MKPLERIMHNHNFVPSESSVHERLMHDAAWEGYKTAMRFLDIDDTDETVKFYFEKWLNKEL